MWISERYDSGLDTLDLFHDPVMLEILGPRFKGDAGVQYYWILYVRHSNIWEQEYIKRQKKCFKSIFLLAS